MSEWTIPEHIQQSFTDFLATDRCKCGFIPDCHETIIAYGKKVYSPHLSMESSFPQHEWSEIHECPECGEAFKIEAESC